MSERPERPPMKPSDKAVAVAIWVVIVAAFLGYWAWLLFIERPW